MKTRSAALILILTAVASAQTAGPAAASKPKTTTSDGDFRDFIELNPFAGGSFFHRVGTGLGTKLDEGGALGIRVTENFWQYVGVEESYTYSVNNLNFLSPAIPGDPKASFGARIHDWSANPVLHFTPRGRKFRPFVTAGLGAFQYTPTFDAKLLARSAAYSRFGASGLNDNLQVGINYGGGVKYRFTDLLGLRFDARGLFSRNPTFGLSGNPSAPGVYIPVRNKINGLQVTGGLTFNLGGGKSGPAAAAPPVAPCPTGTQGTPPNCTPIPAARVMGPLDPGTITVSGMLYQGKPVTAHSTASDPEGHQLNYAWKVNGKPVAGNGSTITFTPENAGDYLIEVAVSDASDPSRATSARTTVPIKENPAPTVTLSANPQSVEAGDPVMLTANATASPISPITGYRYSVSEGSVSGSGTSAAFDSKSLVFDPTKPQTKTITAKVDVTDDSGRSASASTDFRVNFTPKAIRFSDVVFPKGNARVNNCGKRVLIEEVAPKLAGGDYDVYIVGHIDADEAGGGAAKGKRAVSHQLDKQRALNAAAVLSGGSGTCASVDASRIQVDWVGSDQASELRPGQCGTSTERHGSETGASDQNRRVEIWLVPKGAAMPSAVKSPKALPAREMKVLGCPK